eukprot:6072230-Lingulodinium_polyedra.AAC.1
MPTNKPLERVRILSNTTTCIVDELQTDKFCGCSVMLLKSGLCACPFCVSCVHVSKRNNENLHR